MNDAFVRSPDGDLFGRLSLPSGELPLEGKLDVPFYARLATNGRVSGRTKLQAVDGKSFLLVAEAQLSVAGNVHKRFAVISLLQDPSDSQRVDYWGGIVKELRPEEIALAQAAGSIPQQIATLRALLASRTGDHKPETKEGVLQVEENRGDDVRLRMLDERGRPGDLISLKEIASPHALQIHFRRHRINLGLPTS